VRLWIHTVTKRGPRVYPQSYRVTVVAETIKNAESRILELMRWGDAEIWFDPTPVLAVDWHPDKHCGACIRSIECPILAGTWEVCSIRDGSISPDGMAG